MYPGVPGWNDGSLRPRLMVELGTYWQTNRAKHDGNPYRALFGWLCWATFDAANQAKGDQDLEAGILSGRTSAIIRLLLGADKPVHVLTPSATVRRIVDMTALTVADADSEAERKPGPSV